MSRSRRKNPISGNTTCKSEKKDKRFARRVLRGTNRRILQKIQTIYEEGIQDSEQENELEIPEFKLIREVSSIWSFGKDGKMRFSCLSIGKDYFNKLMRK